MNALQVTDHEPNTVVPPGDRIYVVTVLTLKREESISTSLRRSRTWGWFKDLETAVDAVEKNDGDMYEAGTYDTVVIEEIPWGSLAMASREWWFDVIPLSLESNAHAYQVISQAKPAAVEGGVWNGVTAA